MKNLLTCIAPFALFFNSLIWLALLAGVMSETANTMRVDLDLALFAGLLLLLNVAGLMAIPRKKS